MNTTPFSILPLTIARAAAGGLHGATLGGALLAIAIFAIAAVLLAIIGSVLIDYCTAGSAPEDIANTPNAAAIPLSERGPFI